jgi:hypothetical protein
MSMTIEGLAKMGMDSLRAALAGLDSVRANVDLENPTAGELNALAEALHTAGAQANVEAAILHVWDTSREHRDASH